MKKYYCANCRNFKSRLQLKMVDDGRLGYLTCRWCHKSNIYKTDNLILELIGLHNGTVYKKLGD